MSDKQVNHLKATRVRTRAPGADRHPRVEIYFPHLAGPQDPVASIPHEWANWGWTRCDPPCVPLSPKRPETDPVGRGCGVRPHGAGRPACWHEPHLNQPAPVHVVTSGRPHRNPKACQPDNRTETRPDPVNYLNETWLAPLASRPG